MVATFKKKAVLQGVTGTDVLSLADAKLFLRVDHTDEDALITSLIDVSVQKVQDLTGQILDQVSSVEVYLKDFSNVYFPIGPINSVSSVKYFDEGNTERTLESSRYWVEGLNGTTSSIKFDGTMPSVKDERSNPVVITVNVGYEVLPAPLRHAVLLLTSQYYDVRENFAIGTIVSAEIPNGIKALVSEYRNVYFV